VHTIRKNDKQYVVTPTGNLVPSFNEGCNELCSSHLGEYYKLSKMVKIF